ncbi:RNA polymerase sigma factor [Amycolatopsis sp. ATCC 39116]|uniref:RNA polymerase sigma factor n=1 Tax=Amycolatopsis sp. (strain ATCC 39116 / 75iv2) TaxID=385957 RepID=UPI001F418BFE|nr:sigma-70 family RNA polymerase sigma factor [Amycolatopsis sp. ATCC 39116]
MTLRKLYYADLAGYAVKLGCPVSEARTIAEDAVTELVLGEHRGTVGPIEKERAWLFATVRNMALAARRKARWNADADAHLIADRTRQRTWASPEAHLETVETLRALRSLPGSHRDAVVLAAEGFSLREIADALGVSVPAAKKRVSRGRRALRDLLDPPGGRHSDD